jgi:hypothetical protein
MVKGSFESILDLIESEVISDPGCGLLSGPDAAD